MALITFVPTEEASSSSRATVKISRLPKSEAVRQHFERTYAPAFMVAAQLKDLPKGARIYNERYVAELERRVDLAHEYQKAIEANLGEALALEGSGTARRGEGEDGGPDQQKPHTYTLEREPRKFTGT